MTLTQAYLLLGVAIAGEIIATGSLKATDGFTKWAPSIVSILAICFLTGGILFFGYGHQLKKNAEIVCIL